MAAAVELTSGQDHALTMASCQDELLAKTSKIKKSLRKVWEMERSLGELRRIWEMENYQGELGENENYLAPILAKQIQLLDLKKLISNELRLLRPSRAGSGAVHPYTSLPMEGMTVNPGEDRSVFLMVNFVRGEYSGAIYEVKFRFGGEVNDLGGGGATKRVATFSGFNVQGARIFDRDQLYVFTQEGWDKPYVRSFAGHIFHTKTGALDPFPPSKVQFKPRGTFVSAYGTLYFLESKFPFERSRSLGFGKYNPDKKDWVRLPLFPFCYPFIMSVTGYAVCYGVILYALSDMQQNLDVVAFHVARNNWKRVKVDTYTHFRGRAVVVGDTIYALNHFSVAEIIAYSLRRKVDDDGDITYSLVQLSKLNGLEIADPPLQFDELVSDYLVHLGNQDFVHVKTATNEECDEVQHLCITTFQIVQEESRHMIETLHSTVLPVDIEANSWFTLMFGFAPECADYEPVEGETAPRMEQPKEEDEIPLDESSFMWEEEAKLEIASMQHEKANQKDANGINKNRRQKEKKKKRMEGGITGRGSRKQSVIIKYLEQRYFY
ncbi:PREDICTED: uncharacterized protein LOC103338432 [Prunus mume]|uniref:Uncharacterized protein LOC103338432 n=1 Tax=Prunus mume TaxID=102107 RepID=A0ABM0PHW8_PRUMU|nr:PREDICTED: uncharacterized protein LOC103338432 [Prunus mume]